MKIIDIPESFFHGFQLATFHFDFFDFVLNAVEIVQSDFLSGSCVKIAGHWFLVRVHSLNDGNRDLDEL